MDINNNKMEKKYFDGLIIITMAVVLAAIVYFDLEELYLKLSMIPLMIFYFTGQYTERKFGVYSEKNSK